MGSQVICEEIFSDEKRAQETKPSRGGPKKRENLSGSWSDHNGYF